MFAALNCLKINHHGNKITDKSRTATYERTVGQAARICERHSG